ncbi:MAG TPA: Ig-like domain repeat protein [Silvibacterium sp.]|nr:Ig-like domain repeat protein [Silvibacterium sp.]
MLSNFVLTLRFALVCTLSLVATATLAQTTIHVGPGQTYTTIQSGIDAANNGDTVLVAPGTYNENVNFNGKAITVTSSGGAASTIIDGGNKAGVATVVFATGETRTSIISGFTIRGGGDTIFSGTSDGGIYVGGASPTIQGNIVTDNYCHNIDVEFGDATILNNEVSGVLQSSGQFGPDESYCTFGSGIHLQGTDYLLNNLGSTIISNTIENNLTGSGINIWAAQNVLIMNNTIRNNNSPDPGSAFTSANSEGTVIVQNLIYDNTSTCGGALGFEDAGLAGGTPLVLIGNNTIVDNVTPKASGGSECTAIAQIYPGPYSYGSSGPGVLILNNVVSGSTSYPAVNCSWYDPPSETDQPTFQNNILYNAGGPFFGSYCVDVSGKYNNIAADPQFVSSSTHAYRLKETSPAIDSGQNNIQQIFKTMTGLDFTQDFDGNPRVQDATGAGCIIDMGAYEYPGAASNCGTSETLTSSLNPSAVGQSVTFTAQLTTNSGIPTGSIQFLDGTTPLSTQTVSSTGSSSFSTSSLAIGSHNISANYEPTGSFSAGTASLTQVVNGYATTTTLSCLPTPIDVYKTSVFTATVTSANGTPTGAITFTDNGAALATEVLLNGATGFNYTGSVAGTHTVIATYTPTGPFAASSATCSEVVNPLPTTSVLTVTPAVSTYGSPVALSATVSPATLPGPSTPTGVVTFYNGASAVGTATLVNGIASLTPASLPDGSYNLTCIYSGSSIYSVSNCNLVPVVIQAPPVTGDFTINVKPGSVSVYPGDKAKTKVNVASSGGFSEQLALSCTGLPAETSCQFSPDSMTNGQGESALVIQTTPPHRLPASAAAGIARIPGVLAFVIMLGWRRRRGLLAKMLIVFLAANVLFAAAGMLAGCGSPPGATGGTPTGVYQVLVTATTGSGTALTHSAPVTLTVKSY